MIYLPGRTRADISFAVNCCARYIFCLNYLHEEYLKKIGPYLKLTRDHELILNTNKEIFNIDSYSDAYFLACMEIISQLIPSVLKVLPVMSSHFQTFLFHGNQRYIYR